MLQYLWIILHSLKKLPALFWIKTGLQCSANWKHHLWYCFCSVLSELPSICCSNHSWSILCIKFSYTTKESQTFWALHSGKCDASANIRHRCVFTTMFRSSSYHLLLLHRSSGIPFIVVRCIRCTDESMDVMHITITRVFKFINFLIIKGFKNVLQKNIFRTTWFMKTRYLTGLWTGLELRDNYIGKKVQVLSVYHFFTVILPLWWFWEFLVLH